MSRLLGAAALAVLAAVACASETICIDFGGQPAIRYKAIAIAAEILKDAGVQTEFKDGRRSCATLENAIVVTISEQTPAKDHPGALAYAMPFERTSIVVFYDRVAAIPADTPSLLGHVLVHEIAHMFQGVEHHSSTGVMKAKWDRHDYLGMQRHALHFTEEDVMLIRQGLQGRASRAASAPSMK
jgi:hypothetical protein